MGILSEVRKQWAWANVFSVCLVHHRLNHPVVLTNPPVNIIGNSSEKRNRATQTMAGVGGFSKQLVL